MSIESENVFTREQFEELILDGFFRDCPADVAAAGRAFCRFLWSLDGRCHTQNWEGTPHRVAVFSLPIHLRRRTPSKNYAAIYRPVAPDFELWFELVLPSTEERRRPILERFDFSRAKFHALGQPRFLLRPGDSPAGFAHMVLAARNAKVRRLTELLGVRDSDQDG